MIVMLKILILNIIITLLWF